MMFNPLLTLIGTIIIIMIDTTYLYLNKNFYTSIIDPNENISILYAILVWLLIIISIQLIVLPQDNLTENKAFIIGLFLGMASYGVYNLTNASLYPSKWTNTIIIGDTSWGMLITGSMSLILYKLQNVL